MVSRTPTEIWMTILKEAIHVPLFFETDPLTTHGVEYLRAYYYEWPYWQSERVRNRLRRVCKNWNSFLKQFENRYVRLSDVYHDRIRLVAISLAIRLDIEPDWSCVCESHCKVRANGARGMRRGIMEKMCEMLMWEHIPDEGKEKPVSWRLEVLQADTMCELVSTDFIRCRSPNLGSVIGGDLDPIPFDSMSKTLCTLIANGAWPNTSSPTQPNLQLSRLTTLFINLNSLELPFTHRNLPALSYLNISLNPRNTFSFAALENVLAVVGQNLRTLFVTHETQRQMPMDIPGKLWTLVPKVEKINLPGIWSTGPPPEHPLRIIYLPILSLHTYPLTQLVAYILPRDALSWPSKRALQVRYSDTWQHLLFRSIPKALTTGIWVKDFYEGTDVKLTDSEGTTLNDYIFFLIRTYWKDGKGTRSFKYEGGWPAPPL